jgi:hypothetical protein
MCLILEVVVRWIWIWVWEIVNLSTPFALFARLFPSLWFYNYGGDMDRFQVFYTVDHSF